MHRTKVSRAYPEHTYSTHGIVLFSTWLFVANTMLCAQAIAQTQIEINTNELRSIGGITQLDRERFFTHTESVLPPSNTNLGNLNSTIGAVSGLNVRPGRVSTELDQLIAEPLPEDPSRPGFIEPNALRSRVRSNYRDFVNGSRYTSIRSNPNTFLVSSGRRNAFFPDYFNIPGSGGVPRADAYAEFLNIFLEEAYLGNNPISPIDPDRFALELLNEPDFNFNNTWTRQNLSDWHRDVIQAIHAVHPEAVVGGPSLGSASFEDNVLSGPDNFSRFEEHLGRLITDRANSGIGFYSFHPYERYDVTNQNQLRRAVDQSPGRINGTLDLVRSRDLTENPGQTPLPIAITEYGSFVRLDGDPIAAGYTRTEMQWDLARDIREQLLIYLNRPDVILNATPFVQGRHFSNELPTPIGANNVLYEQNEAEQWSETIVGSTFRAYAKVSGSYIGIDGGNDNLQTAAFRDGNKVYVLINNLLDTQQSVDLNVLTALGGIQSASLDRTYQVGENNVFEQNINVLNTLNSLVLNPEEGSVVTLTLTDDTSFGLETIEETFFGMETILPLTLPAGNSPIFTIDATIDGSALEATLRLTYNRPSAAIDGEGFVVSVNGEDLTIEAGILGIDDDDFGLQTREIDVPIDFLVDGQNSLLVDFTGGGGFLAASALVVTSDLNFVEPTGDADGDGDVDGADFLAIQRSDPSRIPLWHTEYGTTQPVAASFTVPEPKTFAMLAVVIPIACAFRYQRLRMHSLTEESWVNC